MVKNIPFYYSHREKLELDGERSRNFFAQFPNVDEQVFSAYKDGEFPAGGGGENWRYFFAYAGSAVLSSATIAAAIKAWIQGRRRKIVISIDGTSRKLEYERPGLSHDIREIELIIEKFADEAGDRRLYVSATESPDKLPASSPNPELKG